MILIYSFCSNIDYNTFASYFSYHICRIISMLKAAEIACFYCHFPNILHSWYTYCNINIHSLVNKLYEALLLKTGWTTHECLFLSLSCIAYISFKTICFLKLLWFAKCFDMKLHEILKACFSSRLFILFLILCGIIWTLELYLFSIYQLK